MLHFKKSLYRLLIHLNQVVSRMWLSNCSERSFCAVLLSMIVNQMIYVMKSNCLQSILNDRIILITENLVSIDPKEWINYNNKQRNGSVK